MTSDQKKHLILVVDDETEVERLFRAVFHEEFEKGKYVMEFALSAKIALTVLREKRESIDIILLISDINMPEVNGLELLKIVKEEFPDLPVYMVTAYGDDTNRKIAEERGASEFITKPVDFTLLKKKIDDILTLE